MANVALINGSSRCEQRCPGWPLRRFDLAQTDPVNCPGLLAPQQRGLGLAFSRYLLQNSNLQVVATTSRDASSARSAILDGIKSGEDNLHTLDMDITNEEAVHRAAQTVQERFGKGNLRLLINVAGVVSSLGTI